MTRRAVIVPDLSDGHCRDLGDAFYPDDGPDRPWQVRVAIRVCRTCPLIDPCRAYAAAAGERHGIWGGHDLERRTRVSRHRKPTPAIAAELNHTGRTTVTNTDTTNDDAAAEIRTSTSEDWAIAVRTGQMIGKLNAEAEIDGDPGELLADLLSDLSDRQDAETLRGFFGRIDQAEAAAKAKAEHEQRQRDQRQAALTAAMTIECPDCTQPPGDQCRDGRHGRSTPHEARMNVAAGDDQ